MNDKLAKPYDPAETEGRIYKRWERSGYFNPDNLPRKDGQPFTIIMPPPNANGHLHAGHALSMTIEDIMIRYKRMQGFKALWLPGADHAGFETQIVYEKKLEKEGRSRFKMEPQTLYDEIMAFTLENKQFMENEVKKLGASCDWSREKFTLDPDIVKNTQLVFKQMYDDGLVYRGIRPVNWCTKHQTSLSDVETETIEADDILYYLKYGPLTVATVRPETMFGDTAVAVNPDDPRWQKYIGQEIEVKTPIGQMILKVIGDESVDKDFGTGALKITPAHDANDFAIGQKHNLPSVEVIDKYGRLNDKTGKYKGLKIKEARTKVVADLTELGLVTKQEAYKHNVPVCYKCQTVIEPRLIDQWYVKMESLAQKAITAVDEGKITFVPDNFRKIFLFWMNNAIDWNISRQIVWGIPIPAKICDACHLGWPDLDDKLTTCPNCQQPLRADTDTFDTWFSSGQWPYLTLGYPKSKDLNYLYPTDIMETGRDLIFKWIPRMVFMSLYATGEVPFKTVYLHGMVNDAKGKKMSKSKGNVVNPLELIDRFGTDALRMGLVIGNTPGIDQSLQESRIKAQKHFANKLWNITRFIVEKKETLKIAELSTGLPTDHELLKEFEKLITEITDDMDNLRFYLAAEKLYHYLWHTMADKLIEASKHKIGDEAIQSIVTLEIILKNSLKMLHPFMPFITEEIWSIIEGEDKILMIESWPTSPLA